MTIRRRRKGSSLIETLVAMAILPLPMGAAIWSMTLSMESSRTSADRLRRQAALDRLSDDLRRDIRRAAAATIGDSGRRLKLERAEEAGPAATEYLASDDGTITRVETGVRPRRECYAIACEPDASGFFRNDSLEIVGAVLQCRDGDRSESTGGTRRIEGALGAETVELMRPKAGKLRETSKD